MKKAGKVFTVISYVFMVLSVVFVILFAAAPSIPPDFEGLLPGAFIGVELPGNIRVAKDDALFAFMVCLVAFVLIGIIGHVMLAKRKCETTGDKVFYGMSFVPFVVIIIVGLALLAVVKFVDIMINLMTGGNHSLASIIDFLLVSMGFKKKSSVSSKNASAANDAFIVIDKDGHERALSFLEIKQDNDSGSPCFTKYYNRFQDDIGNYWRSYDNNQHFVKETLEQTQRGY